MIQHGLRLPDGTEVWPPQQFYGHDLESAQGRQGATEAILQGLRRMHLPESELIDRFKWVVREAPVVHDLLDPNIFTDADPL